MFNKLTQIKTALFSTLAIMLGICFGVAGTYALWNTTFNVGGYHAGDISITENGWSGVPSSVIVPGNSFLSIYSFTTNFSGNNFQGLLDITAKGSYTSFFPGDTEGSIVEWRVSKTPNLTIEDVRNSSSTDFISDLVPYDNNTESLQNIIVQNNETYYLYVVFDYNENSSPTNTSQNALVDFDVIFRQTREAL